MAEIATITSKRQLTIPASVFKKANLKERSKVLVKEEKGRLIVTPVFDLVEKLAGSLKLLPSWRGKSLETIIEEAKKEYFAQAAKK